MSSGHITFDQNNPSVDQKLVKNRFTRTDKKWILTLLQGSTCGKKEKR